MFDKEIKIFNIKVGFNTLFFVGIIITAYFGSVKEYFFVFISMFLHELAHISLANFFGQKIYSIKICFAGLSAEIEGYTANTYQNIIILICGPLTNLLLYTVGFLLGRHFYIQTKDLHFFLISNLYLFVFNMLPILPFDGGKILREILSIRLGFLLSNKYTMRISRYMLMMLFVIAIVQVIVSKYNFSLMLIALFVTQLMKKEQMGGVLLNIKQIICRKARVLKKGIYPVRNLVVNKNMKINEVLKNLDFDRFHILYVLNDDLKLIRVITEQDVFDGIINNNSDITVEELLLTIQE